MASGSPAALPVDLFGDLCLEAPRTREWSDASVDTSIDALAAALAPRASTASTSGGLSPARRPLRTATAVEGLELLKRGSRALKYGRSGKPHRTTFQLSQDELYLSWHGKMELPRKLSTKMELTRGRGAQSESQRKVKVCT